MTDWSKHVHRFAKKHKMTYKQANVSRKCKETYKKRKTSPRRRKRMNGSVLWEGSRRSPGEKEYIERTRGDDKYYVLSTYISGRDDNIRLAYAKYSGQYSLLNDLEPFKVEGGYDTFEKAETAGKEFAEQNDNEGDYPKIDDGEIDTEYRRIETYVISEGILSESDEVSFVDVFTDGQNVYQEEFDNYLDNILQNTYYLKELSWDGYHKQEVGTLGVFDSLEEAQQVLKREEIGRPILHGEEEFDPGYNTQTIFEIVSLEEAGYVNPDDFESLHTEVFRYVLKNKGAAEFKRKLGQRDYEGYLNERR